MITHCELRLSESHMTKKSKIQKSLVNLLTEEQAINIGISQLTQRIETPNVNAAIQPYASSNPNNNSNSISIGIHRSELEIIDNSLIELDNLAPSPLSPMLKPSALISPIQSPIRPTPTQNTVYHTTNNNNNKNLVNLFNNNGLTGSYQTTLVVSQNDSTIKINSKNAANTNNITTPTTRNSNRVIETGMKLTPHTLHVPNSNNNVVNTTNNSNTNSVHSPYSAKINIATALLSGESSIQQRQQDDRAQALLVQQQQQQQQVSIDDVGNDNNTALARKPIKSLRKKDNYATTSSHTTATHTNSNNTASNKNTRNSNNNNANSTVGNNRHRDVNVIHSVIDLANTQQVPYEPVNDDIDFSTTPITNIHTNNINNNNETNHNSGSTSAIPDSMPNMDVDTNSGVTTSNTNRIYLVRELGTDDLGNMHYDAFSNDSIDRRKLICVGDYVLLKSTSLPYVAQIESIYREKNTKKEMFASKFFYRSEEPEIYTGRRKEHGDNEIFYSDIEGTNELTTIVGYCTVTFLDETYNNRNIAQLIPPQIEDKMNRNKKIFNFFSRYELIQENGAERPKYFRLMSNKLKKQFLIEDSEEMNDFVQFPLQNENNANNSNNDNSDMNDDDNSAINANTVSLNENSSNNRSSNNNQNKSLVANANANDSKKRQIKSLKEHNDQAFNYSSEKNNSNTAINNNNNDNNKNSATDSMLDAVPDSGGKRSPAKDNSNSIPVLPPINKQLLSPTSNNTTAHTLKNTEKTPTTSNSSSETRETFTPPLLFHDDTSNTNKHNSSKSLNAWNSKSNRKKKRIMMSIESEDIGEAEYEFKEKLSSNDNDNDNSDLVSHDSSDSDYEPLMNKFNKSNEKSKKCIPTKPLRSTRNSSPNNAHSIFSLNKTTRNANNTSTDNNSNSITKTDSLPIAIWSRGKFVRYLNKNEEPNNTNTNTSTNTKQINNTTANTSVDCYHLLHSSENKLKLSKKPSKDAATKESNKKASVDNEPSNSDNSKESTKQTTSTINSTRTNITDSKVDNNNNSVICADTNVTTSLSASTTNASENAVEKIGVWSRGKLIREESTNKIKKPLFDEEAERIREIATKIDTVPDARPKRNRKPVLSSDTNNTNSNKSDSNKRESTSKSSKMIPTNMERNKANNSSEFRVSPEAPYKTSDNNQTKSTPTNNTKKIVTENSSRKSKNTATTNTATTNNNNSSSNNSNSSPYDFHHFNYDYMTDSENVPSEIIEEIFSNGELVKRIIKKSYPIKPPRNQQNDYNNSNNNNYNDYSDSTGNWSGQAKRRRIDTANHNYPSKTSYLSGSDSNTVRSKRKSSAEKNHYAHNNYSSKQRSDSSSIARTLFQVDDSDNTNINNNNSYSNKSRVISGLSALAQAANKHKDSTEDNNNNNVAATAADNSNNNMTDDSYSNNISNSSNDSPDDQMNTSQERFDLFRSSCFLITGLSSNSDTDSMNSERELTHLITQYGGRRIKSLLELNTADSNGQTSQQLIVISKRPLRTAKYMYSLARGLPPISTKWLQECTAKNQILPASEYCLPCGIDEDDEPIHSINKRSLKSRAGMFPIAKEQRVLHNLVVCLQGTDQFKSEWELVCMEAGAKIYTETSENSNRALECHYIVIETNYIIPQKLYDRAKMYHAHCVNISWLIDSFIRQQLQTRDGKPNYKYQHELAKKR